MDTKIVADALREMVELSYLPDEHEEYGKDHLRYMIDKIVSGEVSGEKSHRWVGWLQACVCIGKGGSLENMKRINKEA